MHTVSFDWFLSGLEWIINLKFCLLIFLIFCRNYYGISDLGLTFPHFEFLSLYLDIFDQNLHFLCKKLQFWSNMLKNSKCVKVSLDLIFYNNFWKNIKSFSKQKSKFSKPDRNQSKLTVCMLTMGSFLFTISWADINVPFYLSRCSSVVRHYLRTHIARFGHHIMYLPRPIIPIIFLQVDNFQYVLFMYNFIKDFE